MESSLRPFEESNTKFAVGIQTRPYNYLMRQARLAKGLSQAQLAEMCGISTHYVQQLETFATTYQTSWETLQNIADVLEQPAERLFPQWLRAKVVRGLASGDLPLPLDEATASQGPDVMQGVLRQELIASLQKALGQLGPREREVIELRFGLNGREPQPCEKVGARFRVSLERIRQIEAKALAKLRRPTIANELRGYEEAFA